MTRSLVLATCRELPHLDGDEEHLVRALKERGVDPIIAAWDGPIDVFHNAGLVVIRSTWDYTQRVNEFVAWAARVEEKTRLENKASVVKWNTHKRYLAELAKEGLPVVPTLMLDSLQGATAPQTLRISLQGKGWQRGVVIKPAVSAGSRDTIRLKPSSTNVGYDAIDLDAAAAHIRDVLAKGGRDTLIQPFIEGVRDGEVSLIYVDGEFSHAVNKKPKSDDFRSQPEFGSHVAPVQPSAYERAAADDILHTVGGDLLYARVDFVKGDDGRPLLMELEIVEPSLYLAYDDGAAGRLADAVLARMPG